MILFDKTEKIGRSTVQHGPHNDRAYLMKLHPKDTPHIVDQLSDLAIVKRYSKIFAKVPKPALDTFRDSNFKIEAEVPGLYNGEETGYFMAQYFSSKRSYVSRKQKKLIKNIVNQAMEAPTRPIDLTLPEGYQMRMLTAKDTPQLAGLYQRVFKKYPFPIFDESYLLSTMESHVSYFGVFAGDQLVAAASAEIDKEQNNAEMTDFATHPDHRGKKLSYLLLKEMEYAMHDKNIKTLYTIARSVSHGMNRAFGRLGYCFGGTLPNNTLIGETIESMNIWYKSLR